MLGRVLVTGGAGYLGSVVVEKLVERGAGVTVVDNLSFGDASLRSLRNNTNFRLIIGDIRDIDCLERATEGMSSVIHLAAIANDPSGELDESLTRQVNFDSYQPLLELCQRRGVRRFVNASSFSVYGTSVSSEITEDHPTHPLKAYSRYKLASESLVTAANGPRLTTCNLRCATICGWSKRMRFDLIANTLMGFALCKTKLEVCGGQQQRPQIHIMDLAEIMIALLQTPQDQIGGETFNVGGENCSIQQLAEIAQSLALQPLQIDYSPVRDDERSYHVNWSKLAYKTGLRARRTIPDAMLSIVKAYQDGLWQDMNLPEYHNVQQMLIRTGTDRRLPPLELR